MKGAMPQEEEGGSDTTNNKFGNLVAWFLRQNGGRVDDRLGLINHNHGGRIVGR